MNRPNQQIVVGYNEKSTLANSAEQAMTELANDGISFRRFATPSDRPDDVATELDTVIGDEPARILWLGGDGTYNLAVNALNRYNRARRDSIENAFMPYGNICDGARLSRSRRNLGRLAVYGRVQPLQPLRYQVETHSSQPEVVNQLAVSYVTIGQLTGGGADYFNQPDVRHRVSQTRHKFLESAKLMWRFYRENPPQPIVDLSINGVQEDATTDVVALNGVRMAGSIKNSRQFFGSDRFALSSFDVRRPTRLIGDFIKMNLTGTMPAHSVNSADIELGRSSEVILQADGEALRTDDICRVRISKLAEDAVQLVVDS